MKNNIYGMIQLTRPVNVLIGGISIIIGGAMTGQVGAWHALLLAGLSGMLITGGANTINDVFDYEIDCINKPRRPLPTGRCSLQTARYWSYGQFFAGCAIGALINPAALIIAVVTAVILYLYSARLKPTPFWGNLTVGVISGMAFVYGGVAAGPWQISAVVGVLAALFHIAREIIKDMEDVEGDAAQGARTIPILYGMTSAKILTSVIALIVIAATLFPLFTDWFSRAYYWIVIPGVDIFLIAVVAAMWLKPRREMFHRLAVLMKWDMLMGLAAVCAGRLF